MTAEELERRRQRAVQETWIIRNTDEGFRISSPRYPGHSFLVARSDGAPTCTCPDYAEHSDDPEWRCKHILAVELRLERNDERHATDPEAIEERRAIQEESTSGLREDRPSTEVRMVIKRSVSPDGRIDALSVEFARPITLSSTEETALQADAVLEVQDRIVRRFLRRNGRSTETPARPRAPQAGGDAPARMVGVGGMDGKWGRRLFLQIQVNGRILRLFGTRTQLAQWARAAGAPDFANDLAEGIRLDLPCRVVMKPSEDGRFMNVEKVLPVRLDGADD